MVRWISASAVTVAAAVVLSPGWLYRTYTSKDFVGDDSSVIFSLEDTAYRYGFVHEGESKPSCPGTNCPLNPSQGWINQAVDPLSKSRGVISNLPSLTTKEGWQGTMYMRWDVKTPAFVAAAGDPVAFDFYGIFGKSWRFFVNGQLVTFGVGGHAVPAIIFNAPGRDGESLTFGFEIDVGRTFVPGIFHIAQPFLSRPGIAVQMRNNYRDSDKVAVLPTAMAYSIIAILAALACFFTPFYHEILVFAVYVTLANWRVLLLNDMSGVPYGFKVDILTIDGMIRCAFYAAMWSFWGLYFRVKSKWMGVPVGAFLLLGLLVFVAGRFGIGLDIPVMYSNVYDLVTGLTYGGATLFGARTWWTTRHIPQATFRRVVSLVLSVIGVVLCASFMIRFAYSTHNITREDFESLSPILFFSKIAGQSFVIGMGLIIALEWSLIVRDRQLVMRRFGTIVDPRLMNDIIHGKEMQSRRLDHVVVLFADLRSFTQMCEVFSPDEVTVALNEYLAVVTTAVKRHGGIVDKFVGDAVMALWGVPEKGALDSVGAVRAAIDIRVGIRDLNARRLQRDLFRVEVGIGLHQGPTIFGAVGSGARVDYTVIGPTINTASRLQALTRRFGCDIVLSRELFADVQDDALAEDLGESELRGMSRRVALVKLIGMRMGDGAFLIGNKTLEDALPLVEANPVAKFPPHVSDVNYDNDTASFAATFKNSG